MRLLPIMQAAFALQAVSFVDSVVPQTRRFWRTRYFDATPAEADDPRPFADVLKERK